MRCHEGSQLYAVLGHRSLRDGWDTGDRVTL
jgi:hypothetical protein